MQLLLQELDNKYKSIKLGGGLKKIEAHKTKGKLTARERIDYLLDTNSEVIEVGAFCGDSMYEDEGGCPGGGVVVVMGYVSSRMCVVVSNDATVKAGAWFPITAKKILRAQEIAMENGLPIIYLVDSAGVYLPLQDEVFPDKEHFGRIFRNNAHMSSKGIIQVSAIMGSCVAGGAYLPIMSDYAFIVEGTGSVFLAGSYLVKSSIGEDVDNETLGGASTHSEISGVTDNKFPNDEACLDAIKKVLDKIGHNSKAGFDRIASVFPKRRPQDIYSILPEDRTKPYDMLDVIQCIVDNSEFEQYKELYGKTILCGLARIDLYLLSNS